MRHGRRFFTEFQGVRPEQQHCKTSGKVMYDKRGAQTVKNTIYDKERLKLRIYQCPDCKRWHLTSKLNWK